LKDSTASVLCQVPVDVASFLLNEKRSEISKIELKQRINVLLVPNKTLETPNYRLERLKHDDPRLDNIEASYKLADEIEDPTGVTRRSQEPTNKQTPIIKGVLPDAPAPQAAPRPLAPVQPAQAQVATPVASAKPAVPAEKGFFGWIKTLFTGEATTPVAPVQAPAAPKPPEGRDGRSRDASRSGGKPGEGRPEGRSDGRGPRGEGRGEGRGRGGRGGRGGADRQGGAQRERFDAEAKPMLADANLQDANPGSQDAARQEVRPDRGPRPERAERPDRVNDGQNREPREPREGRGGRGGRNGRGPRPDGEARNAGAEGRQSQLGFAEGDNSANQVPVAAPASVDTGAPEAPRNETGEPREKRSRDRYGRERGPRGEREERPDLRIPAQPVAAQTSEEKSTADALPGQALQAREPDVAAPVAVPTAPVIVQAAPAEAKANARMPRVTPFALPTEALLNVAQGSGLQWVNSDSDKVAAAQAAIAAEPKFIHVPRERAPAVSIDTGPLVLVETKRDLRNMTLPFEQPPAV
jgi:ribonuclease E